MAPDATAAADAAADSAADDARFEEVADALYAAHPGSFVARRDEAVKAARADKRRDLVKRLQALRRPTATAWAINLLVRERPGDVRDLAELGEAIADAQRRGDGEALRRTAARRRTLTSELVEQARRLAAASDQAVDEYEIEQTLNAAVADPDIAARVLSGRLVSPESYAGFGPMPVGFPTDTGFPTGEAARPPAARTAPPAEQATPGKRRAPSEPAAPAAPPKRSGPSESREPAGEPGKAARRPSREEAAATAQRVAAEEAASDALEQLAAANAEHEEAADVLSGATTERERLAELVEETERRLEELERQLAAADIALRKARRTASVAETRLRAAQRAAETAERRLEKYR